MSVPQVEPQSLHASPRTFSRAALADVDGLKTAFATPTSDQVYADAALNGAEAAALKAGTSPARTISVTTSGSSGTYRTGAGFPIAIRGMRGGQEVTENLLLTAANGGETINGALPFDSITDVRVPGQVNGNGSVQLGVRDVYAPKGRALRALKGHAAGTVDVRYQDAVDDALPVAAHVHEVVAAEAVLGSTAIGVTVYF